MERHPSHKALHEALLEAADASRRLIEQAHAGEHAAAVLAALSPPPAVGGGVGVPLPIPEVKG